MSLSLIPPSCPTWPLLLSATSKRVPALLRLVWNRIMARLWLLPTPSRTLCVRARDPRLQHHRRVFRRSITFISMVRASICATHAGGKWPVRRLQCRSQLFGKLSRTRCSNPLSATIASQRRHLPTLRRGSGSGTGSLRRAIATEMCFLWEYPGPQCIPHDLRVGQVSSIVIPSTSRRLKDSGVGSTSWRMESPLRLCHAWTT